MFGGAMFTPDRFVGGDDPGTTIRALVLRDHDMQAGNMRLLTFIAALIKQNGVELKIEKGTLESLPPRFGIHHRHDATGSIILTLVPVTEQMVAEATSDDSEVTRANAKSETEPTDEELRDDRDRSNDASN